MLQQSARKILRARDDSGGVSEWFCVIGFEEAIDAGKVGGGDDREDFFAENAVFGDDDGDEVFAVFKGDEHVKHGRILTEDAILFHVGRMDDGAALGLGEKGVQVRVFEDAAFDLGIEAVAVDDADHGAVVIDDEGLLFVFAEGLHGGEDGFVGKDGRDFFDFNGVDEAGRTAQERLDVLHVLYDVVARNGDDGLIGGAGGAVYDGVAQFSVIDELGGIAAYGDVLIAAFFDEVGEVHGSFGSVQEFELRFDAIIALQKAGRVGNVHNNLRGNYNTDKRGLQGGIAFS